MTSREPSLEDQLMMPPDPKAKIPRRRAEFWQICWLISLSSLLISLYAVFLSQRLAPVASQQNLDQAALTIADELGRLTIRHGRFGSVGMLEISDGARSQLGLNNLQATLRLDGIVARQLGYDYIGELVSKDAKEAARIAQELAQLERRLADPAANRRLLGRDSLTEIVHKVLSQTGADSRLKSLRITLGGLKHSKFESRAPLPSLAGEQSSFYADGSSYKVHVEVPIWENTSYQFYELADSPSLITSFKQFATIPDTAVASVVLLEAEVEVAERGRAGKIQKMQSCAIVGAPPPSRPGSVFMLSFPQGYFSGIGCLNDLFAPAKYLGAQGEWYQADGAEVPGEGRLVAAPADSPAMPPNLATMNILYHFIFNAGPALLPANLKMLLNEPLASIQVNADDKLNAQNSFNSGLFKDTGSARFALQRQSHAEEGKRLLTAAFSSQPIDTFMPAYTFPLVVDTNGSLNLTQETGFDRQRVREFLDSLYKTNIAGIESMQIGETVIQRMQTSVDQSIKKMSSLREELRSVNQSIESLSGRKTEPEHDKKLEQLKEQSASLEKSLKDEQANQLLSLKIKAKADTVVRNGKEAARSSYEIGSHMSSFIGKGLKMITGPFSGFLLSRSVVFIPHLNPVDEDDLYETDENHSKLSKQLDLLDWTSQQFQVTEMPDASISVDKSPIIDYWQTTPQQVSNKPLFIMLSSNELLSTKSPILYASRQTPFDNGAISKSQLCYFAPQCILTGEKQEVSWSVLARDLVYSMADGAGQPLISLKPRWCLDLGMAEEHCPGLAAEVQIRTPIPKFDSQIPGAYLQDPSGGPSVALYPPLPVDLM